MPKTLHESFHEIVNSIRRLNMAANEVSAELTIQGNISEQKLRRLLTINAKAIQVFAAEKTQSGIGAYSQNELGASFNVGAVANTTENAMATFRDALIAGMPIATDNGLDAQGNSTLLTVTTAEMPTLLAEVDALVVATNWA